MKKKDTLEQFIDDKLAETQFSYQASYWDQAADQMAVWEAEAARKKRFLWFYLFSGVLFIGLAITGIYGLSLRGTPEDQLATLTPLESANRISLELDCDSSMIDNATFAMHPTERSPKVSSQGLSPKPTPNVQTSFSHPKGRTTNTTKQTITQNNTLLSVQNLQDAAKPNDHPIATQIERSAPQLRKEYSLKKILERSFAFRALLNPAFSDQATADPKLSSFNLYIQTGAGFTATQMGESGGSLAGGSSTASIGIRYNFRPGLSLESGLQYHSNRLENLSLSLSGREFDFVAREQSIHWQIEQLHWLSVPLQLSIRPLKRHEITIGGSLDYLATSRGTLRQSQSDPFTPTSTQDLNGNGIVHGLRTVNYSAQLGYRFYVHPRMALDMRYRYGFRNLLDENIWTAEASRFDRQFQVGLMFYLK